MEEWINDCVEHTTDECPSCGKESYNLSHLRDHRYARSGVPADLCPHCHNKFRRTSFRKQFLYFKQQNQKESLTEKEDETNVDIVDTSQTRYFYTHWGVFGYMCHYCGQKMCHFPKFREHVLKHQELQHHTCPDCGQQCCPPSTRDTQTALGGHPPSTRDTQPASGGHPPSTQTASGGHPPPTRDTQTASGGHPPPTRDTQTASGGHPPPTRDTQTASGGHPPPTRDTQPASGGHPPSTRDAQTASGGHPPSTRDTQMASGGHPPSTRDTQTTSGGHPPPTRDTQTASGGHPPSTRDTQTASGGHPPSTRDAQLASGCHPPSTRDTQTASRGHPPSTPDTQTASRGHPPSTQDTQTASGGHPPSTGDTQMASRGHPLSTRDTQTASGPGGKLHACSNCTKKHVYPRNLLSQIAIHERDCGLCGKQVDENAHDHPYSMKRRPFGAFTGQMVGQTLSKNKKNPNAVKGAGTAVNIGIQEVIAPSGSGKESTQPSQTKQTCRGSRKLFCQVDFDHPKLHDHEQKEVPPQVDQSLGLGSDIPSGVTNIATPNTVHSQLRRLLTHGMNIRSETGIVPETGVGIVPAQPVNNNSIRKSATMDHLSLDSPLGLDLLTDLREGNMGCVKSEGSVQCHKGSVQCSKETRRQSKPVQLVFVVSKCSKSTVCIKQGKTTWRPQTRKYCSAKVDQSHKIYICYKCNKAFESLLTLKQHVLGHTPDKSNLKPFPAPIRPPSQIKTWKQKVKGPSKCNQCAKSFTQSASLSRHMKIHSGERSHVCPQCKKAFITSSRLKVHLVTHSGVKPFTCTYCQRGFGSKSNMQMHINRHTGEKPFLCALCGKASTSQSGLHAHMLCHTKEKRYLCQFCGKAFRGALSLRSHVYMHTGERPLKCELCGRGFTLASSLKTHMHTHTHADLSHTCPLCSKQFSQAAGLRGHIKLHTGDLPHECDQCGKRFVKSHQLKNHMYRHTGLMPHVCPQCGKGFSGASYLRVHMYSHRGAKAYPCPHCSKGFNQLSLLKSHVRLSHQGETLYSACATCVAGFEDVQNLLQHLDSHRRLESVL